MLTDCIVLGWHGDTSLNRQWTWSVQPTPHVWNFSLTLTWNKLFVRDWHRFYLLFICGITVIREELCVGLDHFTLLLRSQWGVAQIGDWLCWLKVQMLFHLYSHLNSSCVSVCCLWIRDRSFTHRQKLKKLGACFPPIRRRFESACSRQFWCIFVVTDASCFWLEWHVNIIRDSDLTQQ